MSPVRAAAPLVGAAETRTAATIVAPSSQPPVAPAITSLISGGSASEEVDGRAPSGIAIPETALLGTVVDEAVYGVLDALANFLNNRPVGPFNEFLQGALLMVRRTFFDQAPYLAPVQLTGEVTGPITGVLGAYDAEGEPMTYSVVQAPSHGTVVINGDGSYSYSPDANFDGDDAFIVSATDKAPKSNSHGADMKLATAAAVGGNILDPKRAEDTEALVTVHQGASPQVTVNFTYYVKGLGRWNQKAKTDLQWAAYQLAQAVNPQHSVTLTYKAVAVNEKDGLASASSPYLSQDAGFHMTVVQNRIINGTNPTRATVDGTIDFNFRNSWGYNGSIGNEQYDFQSVAMHELLHTYGFSTTLSKPGCNEYVCKNGRVTKTLNDDWPIFSQYVTNAAGVAAISTEGVWNKAYDQNLVGLKGGLYVNGPNARAAFGGPVPLFTPNPFEQGSSGSHLNDAYFNNNTDPEAKNYIQIMNAKDTAGVKAPTTLSAYEIGILKDIGYTMNP